VLSPPSDCLTMRRLNCNPLRWISMTAYPRSHGLVDMPSGDVLPLSSSSLRLTQRRTRRNLQLEQLMAISTSVTGRSLLCRLRPDSRTQGAREERASPVRDVLGAKEAAMAVTLALPCSLKCSLLRFCGRRLSFSSTSRLSHCRSLRACCRRHGVRRDDEPACRD
jgi:hypothetical protein